MATSKSNEIYAILTSKNDIYIAHIPIDTMKLGKHPKIVSKIDSTQFICPGEFAKQLAFVADSTIVVVVDNGNYSKVIEFDIRDDISSPVFNDSIDFSPKVVLLKSQADFDAVALQTIDGAVHQLNSYQDIKEVSRFPQLCRDFELVVTSSNEEMEDNEPVVTAFGISTNGKLFADSKQIATAVTSLKTTESHLLFTTAQSQLCFIHLKSATGNFEYDIFQKANDNNESSIDERVRQIERGSILVNAMPSKYSVVLEAPRGNLETICPRIMVLSGVRKFIKQKNYKEAFLACRTHRIDLDILHDYDPELFFANVEAFINQIKKVEHLDLFVSCLHEEDVTLTKYKDTISESENITTGLKSLQLQSQPTPVQNDGNKMNGNKLQKKDPKDSKVNRICEKILSILLKPEYFEKYLQTIITAYACENPPNLSDALQLVGGFKSVEQTEQAVVHLCFLQDVNKLYDTALGLYDVKLTLSYCSTISEGSKRILTIFTKIAYTATIKKTILDRRLP